MPTSHRGPTGRIITLIIDKKRRRTGIGTRLLIEAENEMTAMGCEPVEALSDIDVTNAHDFFRTLKFGQTSYRFAHELCHAT